jgi:hypothetical protein
LRPLSAARYMPDRHRLTSRRLDLDLAGEPLVAAPAHALPIEYMEGPYRYHGTLRGKPVSGFAFYERSIAMYRDWELADVLVTAVADLENGSQRLTAMVAHVRTLIGDGRGQDALGLLCDEVLPVVEALPAGAEVPTIIDDLVNALR